MKARLALRSLATILILGGGLAAIVVSFNATLPQGLGGMNDQRLLPFALLIAVATTAAGVAIIFRPWIGVPSAVLALAPQAVSFAAGSVAYSLNLWPNYRVELSFPGSGNSPVGAVIYDLQTPSWLLITDASYIGVGLGFDLVASGLILAVVGAYLHHRRAVERPNHSFKPTPSARLNSRR